MNQQRFVELLENVLTPDTKRVKLSTSELKKNYYTSPESLGILLQLLTSHDSPQLRQLAATQARSLVPKHWQSIPKTHKPEIRNHLLQACLNEQTPLVRHSVARVISAIAKIDVEDGEWADLPTLMLHAANSSNVQHREVSTYILFSVLESFGDGLVQRFQELFALFSKTIHDPESAEVRINTMASLGKIALAMDAEDDKVSLRSFQDAMPQMMAVLKQAVDGGDEDRSLQGFEVFQTLLTCDSKLLNNHFRDLVQFMANIGFDKAIDDDARIQAISFLIQTVTYRKLKFQSLKIGEMLTLGILEVVTEFGDASDDDDELTVATSALGLLSVIALYLPPNQVVVPLLGVFRSNSRSPDPKRRQAMIRALGTCVEGAPDLINTQLQEFLPSVLRLLDDPDLGVREAALSGIRLLADQLAEDMGKEHQKLIPALGRNLDRAMQDLNGPNAKENLNIVKASCSAIDSLIDGLEPDDLEQYLPELVPHLSRLFKHPDLKVKGAAIGAIGSIALSAKEQFLPYFQQSMNALSDYVHIKDSEEELDLRCISCDAMGNMALAVGSEQFQRYVLPLMQATEEGLHLDHSRLKETCFLFWSDIAKVYEENFKTFLPGVVKALFESLEQEETDLEVELGEEAADLVGKEVSIAGRMVKVAAVNGEGMEGVDDDSDGDDEDDDDWDEVTGVTAFALEKEVALEVVANMMAFTKREYLPYLEKSLEIILPMVDHSFEGVRRAAVSTLFRAYASLWNLQTVDSEEETWQKGLPLKIQPPEDIMKLGEVIMVATLALWQREDDRQTVVDIHNSLAETLKLCGPAIISGSNVVGQITQILISIISKKHPCQQDFGDDEEDLNGLEESSEYDWLIIDTAFDVIMGLSQVLGDQFAELWKIFEKNILVYASSSENAERCSAVGTIAECIGGMGSAVTPFTTGLLKVLVHRLSDEDEETKANAAFAVGLLVLHSGKDQEILKSYNTILMKLEPLLQAKQSRQLDNAAGCVSRMIMKHKNNVPLSQVLPALVELLPLQSDYEENDPVYRMIVQLYSSGEPTIIGLTSRLIPKIAEVMAPPLDQLQEGAREQLLELVTFLHNKASWKALIEEHGVLMSALQEA